MDNNKRIVIDLTKKTIKPIKTGVKSQFSHISSDNIQLKHQMLIKNAHILLADKMLDSQGWKFKYDTSKSRAGLCDYNKKIISLSKHLVLNTEISYDQIHNTLLHEIAHAIVGPYHHHNSVWRKKALEIGCDGKRCHNMQIAKPKYFLICEHNCFKKKYHRLTNKSLNKYKNSGCAKCKTPLKFVKNV